MAFVGRTGDRKQVIEQFSVRLLLSRSAALIGQGSHVDASVQRADFEPILNVLIWGQPSCTHEQFLSVIKGATHDLLH